MSFLKGKMGRSVAAVAFTLGAYQALSIVGAIPAQAAALCAVSGGVITISTDVANDNFRVYADTNGGIHVAELAGAVGPSVGTGGNDLAGCTGVQAGLATTTAINVTGASGAGTQDQTVWIELSEVNAAALNTYTATPTPWGAINWTVSLGANDSTGDSLEVVSTGDTAPHPVDVTAGANGIDLNSDGNLDVTTAGVENFYFDSFADEDAAGNGNTVDLNGSTITGGPFPSAAYIGWSSVNTHFNAVFDAGVANTTSLIGTDDGLNTLSGGIGNDNIHGSTDGDLIAPGLGSDQVNGGGVIATDGWFADGQDTLDYSDTTTAINVNLPGNTVSQGTDIDTIVPTIAPIEDVIGTSAADTILGDGGNNWIEPEGGNDVVTGGLNTAVSALLQTGGDTVDYSDSTAGVTVDLGAGTETGGSGTDTLATIENVVGSPADDSLTGNSGANLIWAGSGNDTLSGGAGDGDGADYFNGGGGIDTVDYGNNTLATTVDLNAVVTSGIAGEGDIIQAGPPTIENAILGTGDDQFFGTAFNNIVYPNGGQNSLGCLLTGCGGIDTVNYSMGYTAGVTINLSNGGGTGGSSDSITGFANAVGTAFNDNMTGSDVLLGGGTGANLLVGGKGNDSISGNAGPDLIRGGAGNDNVRGGSGDDNLYGGGGNDNLRGGTGDDNIWGGKGKDFCIGGGGHDLIKSCEKPVHHHHGPNGPSIAHALLIKP